jgi:hypothetical protein
VYTIVYWTLRGFVCASWVVVCESASWRGMNVSCLIRVTSMHYIKSIRMFEDDVT